MAICTWPGGRVFPLVVFTLVVCVAGCESPPPEGDYVARVGSSVLLREDLESSLGSMPSAIDSAHAAGEIIDRWITDELLAREARRRDLLEDADVRRRIKESERSVLISSLITELYEDVDDPNEREIRNYFERNRDNLTLREPFVRVRYMATEDSAGILQARDLLASELDSTADSTWQVIVREFAVDPEESVAMAMNYFPESRVFVGLSPLADELEELQAGQVSSVVRVADRYYVFSVVDRVPTGTVPRLEWVISDIRNRLLIEKRKQMYTDHVQQLRNNALARGQLEVAGN